jgi:hypothetical protein
MPNGSLRRCVGGRSGGRVFHAVHDLHELHGGSDAVKLGHPSDEFRREERLRRLGGLPDVKIERLLVDRIERERLGA